jgi:hypothetical protein
VLILNESAFPRLTGSVGYELRSPPDEVYNCIAFAADETDRWWWPIHGSFWPPGVPRDLTLDAFIAAFETIGYQQCSDDSFEPGYEKVTLYALDGVPKHAARQEPATGMWLSKLGMSHDIAHARTEDVGGGVYGEPVRYLYRPTKDKTRRSYRREAQRSSTVSY